MPLNRPSRGHEPTYYPSVTNSELPPPQSSSILRPERTSTFYVACSGLWVVGGLVLTPHKPMNV